MNATKKSLKLDKTMCAKVFGASSGMGTVPDPPAAQKSMSLYPESGAQGVTDKKA